MFRFKNPSWWFIWFVQKPFAEGALTGLWVASYILAVAVPIALFIVDRNLHGTSPAQITQGFTLIGVGATIFVLGQVARVVSAPIKRKRDALSKSQYREFYLSEDDFSFDVLYTSSLIHREALSHEQLIGLLADPGIVAADKMIRSLVLNDHPEAVISRWREQRRILQLVKTHYLQNGLWNNDVRDELEHQGEIIDTMFNGYARKLFRKHNGYTESLNQLIQETDVTA